MRRLTSLLLVAGLLAGCSSIPSSGPIVTGDRVDVVSNDVNVRVIARPPVAGMSPEAIVRGFIAACASIADGDETARKYLTPSAALTWNPQALAAVYEAAALTVTPDRNDSVKVSAPLLGTIGVDHRYRIADPGAMLSESLHLTQVHGQWRIDQPPPALYLGEGDLARSYRAHALYFLNATRDRMVPSYVMLPNGSGNLPTMLMRSLLAGPPPIAGATLVSDIPGSTSLSFGAVLGDFGLVGVPLTRAALSANWQQRNNMLAQITWTLTGLPSISSVRVQVDGEPLQSLNGGSVFTAADFANLAPVPADATTQPLVFVSGNRVISLRNGARTVIRTRLPVQEAAVSPDGTLLVHTTPSRSLLFASRAGKPMVVFAGGDLASPTILSSNQVWFLDRSTSGGLFTWRAGGSAVKVKSGLPSRSRILDFAIAPDQSRIAIIVNDGASTSIWVAHILQTADGARLVGLERAEQRLSSVVGVAWTSESELAVLGAVGAVAVQALRITLPTGAVTLLGGPANAVAITAALGRPIVVGDQSGQLWQLSGVKWEASDLGTAPNYVM
ncbi:MAG: LpqB family beta-propeller domain-containing protein [Candidatus Nanopelagicales bacterium]